MNYIFYLSTLKHWFRQFIESRDAQAAERCIATAVRLGANSQQMADMFFAAATDHRFLDVGHTLNFNKALEALDELEWENNKSLVESVLTSYATAERMEESGSWRHPIDLVTILENAFKELPVTLDKGKRVRATIQREQKTEDKQPKQRWGIDNPDRDALMAVLLGDDPQSIVNALLEQFAGIQNIKKNGCYRSYQKFYCKCCKKNFNDKTDTILHYSRAPLKILY